MRGFETRPYTFDEPDLAADISLRSAWMTILGPNSKKPNKYGVKKENVKIEERIKNSFKNSLLFCVL